MSVLKSVAVSVNAGSKFSEAVEIGPTPSYFEAVLRRTAGTGVVNATVQGAFGNSDDDNDWVDLVDVDGIDISKAFTLGTRVATFSFYRLRAQSAGAATMKMTIVGISR